MAAGIKISGSPYPFALTVGTPNGTEVFAADQTASGVLSTVSIKVAQLFGATSISYPSGGGLALTTASTSAALSVTQTSTGNALTVAGGAFQSRGILDSAAATALTIASGGAVTVAAPTSGNALTATAVSGAFAASFQSSTSGAEYGVNINAGTASSDINLRMQNGAGNTNLMTIWGNGGVTIGGTATNQGTGTLNVQSTVYGGDGVIGGIQANGYTTTGFTGAGAELGVSGGIAYLQGYNRTSSAYIPTVITGSTVSLSPSNAGYGVSVAAAGNVTISASTGVPLSATGVASIASYAAQFTAGSAGQSALFVGRSAGVGGIAFNTMASTGSATPTLSANKPGTSSGVATWLVVTVDGNTRYIPCWS